MQQLRDAFSIAEFCAANSISRSTYYRLRRCGQGPDEMFIFKKPLISAEAAARWRDQMTRSSKPQIGDQAA